MPGPWAAAPATMRGMLQLPPVDRSSPVPPYRQVAAALIALVRSGQIGPGERLPSIVDIVQSAGIARYTAAKALRLVQEEGYAELSEGMGYWVPARLPRGTAGAHDDDRRR